MRNKVNLKKSISIIMSVYNNEKTIKDSVNSILNQTFQNWIFIICDDNSNDNTYNILKKYKKRYPKKFIILKNKKNKKLAFSLNRCLKYSKGKYTARMDGDDISLPTRLERQYEFLEKNPNYDLVGTSMIPFDEKGKRNIVCKKMIPNKYDLLMNPCFNHATIIMKTSVYKALKGYTVLPRTTRGQDYDLWFRFFKFGYKGFNLQEPLYMVRESVKDLKRRTIKTRIQAVGTAFYGYKLLNYPLKYYIFAFKPLLAGIIPKKVMYFYHKNIKEIK